MWFVAEREKSKLLHIVERLFSGGRVRSRRFETQMMKLLPSKPFCQHQLEAVVGDIGDPWIRSGWLAQLEHLFGNGG